MGKPYLRIGITISPGDVHNLPPALPALLQHIEIWPDEGPLCCNYAKGKLRSHLLGDIYNKGFLGYLLPVDKQFIGDCDKNVSLCNIQMLIFFHVNLSLCLNILKTLKQPRYFSACSYKNTGRTKKTKGFSVADKLTRN